MKAWVSLGILCACLAGCGQSASPAPSSPSDAETGRALLSLTGTGSDGATYRIVGWSLRFEGPQSVVVPETSTDPVTVPLKVGSYTVALEGSWRLERDDAPGVPVDVTLVSPNPLGLVVRQDQDTPVRFIFKLPPEGSTTVTIGVDPGGWISGSVVLSGVEDPDGTHTFDALLGVPLTFTISYDSSRITRETFSTSIEADQATVQFGGTASAVLDEGFALALSGRPLDLDLVAGREDSISIAADLMNVCGGATYQLDLLIPAAPGTLDANSSPQLGMFIGDAQLRLTKNEAVASGSGTVTVEAR